MYCCLTLNEHHSTNMRTATKYKKNKSYRYKWASEIVQWRVVFDYHTEKEIWIA